MPFVIDQPRSEPDPASEPPAERKRSTVAVVVASRGRPTELGELYESLRAQTRPPEQVIFSVTREADLPDALPRSKVDVIVGSAGSCIQRNRGLEVVKPDIDLVAIFDDDYVPRRDVMERGAKLFAEHPSLVAADGHLAADGIHGPGLTLDQAHEILAQSWDIPTDGDELRPAQALYGCNMIFRASAIGDVKFDEHLPLNGWQEDIDFSARVGRRGDVVHCRAFVGVHRGVKSARVSGRRFGYAQIVNPAYLARKGTMPAPYAFKIASQNVLANLAKCLAAEPWVDRRGRLVGNLLGVIALLRGRNDPRLILDIRS